MSKTILLVEDNPTDQKLTVRAFKECSALTHMAVVQDGAEALDFLFATGAHSHRSAEPLPALVLVDLKLPRIDGLELIQRLREDERTRLLPIVVLTASVEDRDVARSYELGANAYIRKPVDFSEFVEAASIIGTFWLRLNQAPRLR